jgi:hypothetical protein
MGMLRLHARGNTYMTGETGAPLHRDLFYHAAELAHSRDELQSQFHSVDGGRGALVLRANRFLQYYFRQR